MSRDPQLASGRSSEPTPGSTTAGVGVELAAIEVEEASWQKGLIFAEILILFNGLQKGEYRYNKALRVDYL